MFTISPSIYSCDIMNLGNAINDAKEFEHLHIDIDDGNFVSGISFGMDVVYGVCDYTIVPVDVHLEVLNPMDYVKDLACSGIAMACAHVEALDFPSHFLSILHNGGKKAGLSLNIKTPVSYIEPYIDQVDYVLVVSVEADDDGLIFRPGILKKIQDLRKILKPETMIWVDGGINKSNLEQVVKAGADGVVLGRAVFKTIDPNASYKEYLELGRKYEQGRNDDLSK